MGRSLPFPQWPMADQKMWLDLVRQGGLFEDHGAFARLRPTSLKLYQSPYGRWLDWLKSAAPDVLADEPASRATLPRLRAWLDDSPNLRPMSRKMYFIGALRVLTAAYPTKDWSAHLRVARGLEHAAGRGDPARKQGRILPSDVLLEAAQRLAGPLADMATTPLQRAKAQRDGAMMAFLAMMPQRHGAFTGLRIGESLLVTTRALTIVLPEALNKTHVVWEAEVPEPAAEFLRRYLSESRPFLLSRAERVHDFLWVGNQGAPMSYSYIGKKIPEITMRLTGVKIPQHFFRDSAATTLARDSRKAALLIAPVLGHSGSRTSERHYNQAGSVEVGRELANVIKRLKEKI